MHTYTSTSNPHFPLNTNHQQHNSIMFQAARAATAMFKVNVDVWMLVFCMLDSKRKAIRQEEDRSHEPLGWFQTASPMKINGCNVHLPGCSHKESRLFLKLCSEDCCKHVLKPLPVGKTSIRFYFPVSNFL